MNDLEYYRGKRVCVTGATGLIGSYAVELLVESGALVSATRHHHGWNLELEDVYDVDLLSPTDTAWTLIEIFRDLDVVINCAGITGGVGLPSKDPVSYVGPATAMVCNVLHACHLAKVERFGFLSSTTVYRATVNPVTEDIDDSFSELYPLYRGIGESKRFLEKLCRYYHETTGIGVGIVRPSGAYGRFDNFDPETSHVVPGMIDRALKLKPGEAFEIWGDGEDVRDIIHAEDAARGLLLAVAKRPDCTPINIASGKGIRTCELAGAVIEAVDPTGDHELKTNPSKPSALKSRTVNISRAREMLGFEPRISLADGLADTVKWRREQL
ncbi:MAG: NAD-dependent epimerase/dehydratase family protein [Anaerolineae bacterium]|nr:MAG: NAD-dependent epimerase/dehydratase family protein [Anaerolineae bacterium]